MSLLSKERGRPAMAMVGFFLLVLAELVKGNSASPTKALCQSFWYLYSKD